MTHIKCSKNKKNLALSSSNQAFSGGLAFSFLLLPQQVSDILLHPKFHSAPDASVAVLKLRDKAKISEHVLPVCLPKVQEGEVTARGAYTMRWILPNEQSRSTPSSQTELVGLGDVAQCEREFIKGGEHSTVIRDNTLCVIRKLSKLQSSCPSFVPGITAVSVPFPSTSAVLSGHNEWEISSLRWQLLGLEGFGHHEKNCHQQIYKAQIRIDNFLDWIVKNMK